MPVPSYTKCPEAVQRQVVFVKETVTSASLSFDLSLGEITIIAAFATFSQQHFSISMKTTLKRWIVTSHTRRKILVKKVSNAKNAYFIAYSSEIFVCMHFCLFFPPKLAISLS